MKKSKGKCSRSSQVDEEKIPVSSCLSQEELDYYEHISILLQQDLENRDILISNFFREVEKDHREGTLVCDKVVSAILDDTLPLAPVDKVISFTKVFKENLVDFCTHPCASHVLQTLLVLALRYIQTGASQKLPADTEDDSEKCTEISDAQKKRLTKFLHQVAKSVCRNLEDFICHRYATYLVRTVLEVCSGISVKDSMKRSQRSQKTHELKDSATQILSVTDRLKKCIPKMAERLIALPQFADVVQSNSGSAVLQTAVTVMSCVDQESCKMLVDHIMSHGFPRDSRTCENEVHPVFENDGAIWLMEAVISNCSCEQRVEIFEKYFKGRMQSIIEHKHANFTLQKLLRSWKDKNTFTVLYGEVADNLHISLRVRHTGVILALVAACRQFASEQSSCEQALLKVFGCHEAEPQQLKFAVVVLCMLPLAEYDNLIGMGQQPRATLHGSCTIQEMLRFNSPLTVSKSILEMKPEELVELACNPYGSHIFDVYATSPSVSNGNRKLLIQKLKKYFVKLACCSHGSRSLEALWKVAGMKMKSLICTELLSNERKVMADRYGAFLYRQFKVSFFKKKDKTVWMKMQDNVDRKRKILDDLLEDASNTEVMAKKLKPSVEEDFVLTKKPATKKKKHLAN